MHCDAHLFEYHVDAISIEIIWNIVKTLFIFEKTLSSISISERYHLQKNTSHFDILKVIKLQTYYLYDSLLYIRKFSKKSVFSNFSFSLPSSFDPRKKQIIKKCFSFLFLGFCRINMWLNIFWAIGQSW